MRLRFSISRPPGLHSTLASFRVPGYRAFWASSAASAVGWSASLVAIGWIALQVSHSPFAVGATFAARLAPALLFGIPFGALGDRFNRRAMLVAVNVLGTACLLGLAAVALAGRLGLTEIIVASLLLGMVDTLRGTTAQSYAYDLAGNEGATNAIALSNLGAQLVGAAGGAIGGLVLDRLGSPAAFSVAAAGSAMAASVLAGAGRDRLERGGGTRLVPGGQRSMTLILRNRPVALIALAVIFGEVLGFSSLTLYPTFARDILRVDATGLGTMSAARALGGVCGGLLLAASGLRDRGGVLLLGATGVFGLGILGFALSDIFLVSLGFLLIIGAAGSALDTLGQSLIQRNVEDRERGAAMGVWFFAIGFGPFGHLGMGAAGAAIGGPAALAASGSLLLAACLGLARITDLRRIR